MAESIPQGWHSSKTIDNYQPRFDRPRMELTLPHPLAARMSPKDAALHLAIGLFVTEEATLGQAAETAGLSQANFLRELGRRRIPIHYGPEELASDLRKVEALAGR